MQLPPDIMRALGSADAQKAALGRSGAGVFRYAEHGLFLKIEPRGGEIKKERDALLWLACKLPVPKVEAYAEDETQEYLLTQEARGNALCSDYYAKNPLDAAYALADGLRLLRGVDIAGCPFSNALDIKLRDARELVNAGLVDMSDWEPETDFASPRVLLEWLETNRPPENLVFCHGDYCVDNIFGIERAATGFIDLGRCGVADEWQDLALALRSLWHSFGTREYDALLLAEMGVPLDARKLQYYILLDELF